MFTLFWLLANLDMSGTMSTTFAGSVSSRLDVDARLVSFVINQQQWDSTNRFASREMNKPLMEILEDSPILLYDQHGWNASQSAGYRVCYHFFEIAILGTAC